MSDFLKCGECDEIFERMEAGEAVYECSRCSERLVGERRCENDNIFMAKIGDISCPFCEAPEEDLTDSNEEEAVARQKQKAKDAAKAEKDRPAQEKRMEEEMARWRKKADAEAAPWKGDESLGHALGDVRADHDHPTTGDLLGAKWDWYFGDGGSTGIGISRDEGARICEMILDLREEVRELKE